MPSDPLALFKKASILDRREPETPLPSDDEYVAFHAVDRDQKCLLAQAVGIAWVRANYTYFQYVTEDEGRGRMLYVVFGFMVIEVRGRNLSPVAEAISRHACPFIQQFDASRWRRPKDSSAPFIDAIKFHHGAEMRGALLGKEAVG